ncbi:hypothetical protein O0L34_g17914 [Tuta absoluta]|nr:hypothetical protein O0L34_g17914 [Tuta absoluta]
MSTRLMVLIAALAAVSCQPIEVAQNNQQNFVPGVFISADTLKDLQEKAAQNQSPPITNQGGQPITNTLSANSQSDEPSKGTAYQANSSPQNQQPILPAPVQPQVVVAQPAQPNQVMVSQPNQYIVQQPAGNQPVYISQPANQQTYVQPNQQVVLSNGQIATIVTNGQPFVNSGQPFVSNGQTFVNNGQPFVNNGQPMIVSTNPATNQITLVSSPNTVQNPNGVQYAVIPNNNMVANTNVPNNGNTFVMVPSSNQVYAVSG